MGKEWRWWLGEFGTATAVGIISSIFTKDIPISILCGLVVGTVFFILRENKRLTDGLNQGIAEWEDKALELSTVLGYLQNLDPYFKKQVLAKKDELLRLAKDAKDGEITFRPRSIQQIAIDILRQAKPGEKIFATSYINPEAFWCTPEGELYRQACFDLASQGVEITRIFIESSHATERDKQCVMDEVRLQRDHKNVKLRKTLESRLPPEARKDILLIPGRYLVYLGIGTGDILEELRICTATEELEKAKSLVDNLLQLSQEYETSQ
jgi:hypothetical protein